MIAVRSPPVRKGFRRHRHLLSIGRRQLLHCHACLFWAWLCRTWIAAADAWPLMHGILDGRARDGSGRRLPMWVAAVVCSHAVDVHDVRARYVHARQGCGVAADVNGRRLRIVDVRREAVGIKQLTSGTCLPTRASWDWGQARAPWSHANASFGVGWP